MANSVTRKLGGNPGGWGSVRTQLKADGSIAITVTLKDHEVIGRPSRLGCAKSQFNIQEEDFKKSASRYGNPHFGIAQFVKGITKGSRLDDFFDDNPCSLEHVHDAIGYALRDLTGVGR